MSVRYSGIGWNRHKRVYDAAIVLGMVAFLAVFFVISQWRFDAGSAPDPAVSLMRAFGACAIVLLHIVLCIGPLARLDRRFLPLLYNRRHLGVSMFLVSLLHAVVAFGYYHGFGGQNPLRSLLVNTTRGGIPFEIFGLGALLILFLMAATSHDFWLKNLSPRIWKSLHMGVYVAYILLIAHVGFGALAGNRGPLLFALMAIGAVNVASLHIAAGTREVKRDRGSSASAAGQGDQSWVDVCAVDDIPEKRAVIACLRGGERIAVFRHDGKISAVSNVCEHQNGPLGEGQIIDGCITCPWHGYQYLPESGRSPPPFTERIATYHVRIVAGNVQVDPRPNAKGTPVEPARIHAHSRGSP